MRSSNEFTTLIMDIGEVKVRFRNYLEHHAGSTKEEAEKWLMKQPLYQIYLPAPKYIPRPSASTSLFAKPNDIHLADILYLPHDRYQKKVYKYASNIVDLASRYKGSYQLTTKNRKEVAQAFQWIYENMLLTYPKTLTMERNFTETQRS